MSRNPFSRGFFRNAFGALVEARQKQAATYVNGMLLTMDDDTLRSYGYSRDELKRRGGASYPF